VPLQFRLLRFSTCYSLISSEHRAFSWPDHLSLIPGECLFFRGHSQRDAAKNDKRAFQSALHLALHCAIVRPKLVCVMLAPVATNFTAYQIYVLKFLIPFCMPIDKKQHCNRLLMQEIVVKVVICFAIKAVVALRIPCLNYNFPSSGEGQ
jgi:hypothetical protein